MSIRMDHANVNRTGLLCHDLPPWVFFIHFIGGIEPNNELTNN